MSVRHPQPRVKAFQMEVAYPAVDDVQDAIAKAFSKSHSIDRWTFRNHFYLLAIEAEKRGMVCMGARDGKWVFR